MDDLVKRAMARWPSVPAVHGWLRLGRRGTWFLIDRNAPGFDPVRDSGGSPITSPPIIDFIQRNYEADGEGNWYFQNGPQRVFVTLDHAPLIFRVTGDGDGDGDEEHTALALVAHPGRPVGAIHDARFDRQGNLFLQTDVGPGMVDDRDLVRLAPDAAADEDAEGDVLRLALPRYGFKIEWRDGSADQALPPETIAALFGYQRRPEAPPGSPPPSARVD